MAEKTSSFICLHFLQTSFKQVDLASIAVNGLSENQLNSLFDNTLLQFD